MDQPNNYLTQPVTLNNSKTDKKKTPPAVRLVGILAGPGRLWSPSSGQPQCEVQQPKIQQYGGKNEHLVDSVCGHRLLLVEELQPKIESLRASILSRRLDAHNSTNNAFETGNSIAMGRQLESTRIFNEDIFNEDSLIIRSSIVLHSGYLVCSTMAVLRSG